MLLGSCENEATAAQLALLFGRKERGDVYVSVNMTRFEEKRKKNTKLRDEYLITSPHAPRCQVSIHTLSAAAAAVSEETSPN